MDERIHISLAPALGRHRVPNPVHVLPLVKRLLLFIIILLLLLLLLLLLNTLYM